MAEPGYRPRREEYPDQTRAAVIDAARQLFAKNGFFQTKVEQIAKLSRVSPATVYAQCGGKQGLLRSLMDNWTQTPMIVETMQASLGSDDPARVIQALTTGYLSPGYGSAITFLVLLLVLFLQREGLLRGAQRRQA